MNNVILIGTIVDLNEVHEDCLIARIKVYRVNTQEYDLIPIYFNNNLSTIAYESLYEGCHIMLKGVIQMCNKNLIIIATHLIKIDRD